MSKEDGKSAQLIFDSIPLDVFDEQIFIEGSQTGQVPSSFLKNKFKVIQRQGRKGELLKDAISETTCSNIVVLGADGADNPEDIQKILIKLKQGCQLVVGSRFLPEGGRRTHRVLSYRSIGNRFFSFLLSIIFSKNVSDANNLFRGFKKSSIQQLDLKENGESIMFEMTVLALENNLTCGECPTIERPSLNPRSKRNRFISAISFCWLLTKYLVDPRTKAKRRR